MVFGGLGGHIPLAVFPNHPMRKKDTVVNNPWLLSALVPKHLGWKGTKFQMTINMASKWGGWSYLNRSGQIVWCDLTQLGSCFGLPKIRRLGSCRDTYRFVKHYDLARCIAFFSVTDWKVEIFGEWWWDDGWFLFLVGEMSIWGCNDILKTFFGWTYQLAEALVGWLWCNFPSLHLNRRCYSHHHDIQGYLKLPANKKKRCEAGFLQRSWTPVSHKQDPYHSHPGLNGFSPQEQDGAMTGEMPPLMSTDQEFGKRQRRGRLVGRLETLWSKPFPDAP